MSLCTRDDVKDRIGETSTDYDDVIDQIIAAFAAMADRYCHRPLIVNDNDETEYVTGTCHLLRIDRYPIVSITSIKEAWDYDFDHAAALTADTDYRLAGGGRTGVLQRIWGVWAQVFESVQVVYKGGYCAAGVSPSGDEAALPADLREAAIEQCSFLFKRRDDIGLAGVSFDGGSFNKFESIKLLPHVKQILQSYRRLEM